MKQFFITLLAVVSVLGLAVWLQPTETTAVEELTAALEQAGYEITVEQPKLHGALLSGESYRFVLNADTFSMVQQPIVLDLFVYDTASAALRDVSYLDSDGCGVNRPGGFAICVEWVDVPHFFLYKNAVVQYIGRDAEILKQLEQLCGAQVAGLPVRTEKDEK